MGVLGLTGYIRHQRETFLRDYNLQGSNLIYILYKSYGIPFKSGGDYYDFAAKCKKFFETLTKKCHVVPIVIFDEADDPSDLKLETHLKRLDQQFANVQKIIRGNTFILPLLADLTFRNILDKLGVAHASCLFEAVREIAFLANKFECPVLSADSDFCVFNLKVGFIHPDDLLPLPKNCRGNLPTKIYKCQDLMNVFNRNPDGLILPVFATLAGNDYAEFSSDAFIRPMNAPMAELTSQMEQERSHAQFTINWLSRFHNGKEAFANVKGQLTEEGKNTFEKSVMSYCNVNSNVDQSAGDNLSEEVRNMSDQGAGDNLSEEVRNMSDQGADDNLSEEVRNMSDQGAGDNQSEEVRNMSDQGAGDNLSEEVRNMSDQGAGDNLSEEVRNTIFSRITLRSDLPEYFIRNVIKCDINSKFLLNIAIHKRYLFKSQIENLLNPPSFACSKGIRRVIYEILVGQSPQEERMIKEHHRTRLNVSDVDPLTSLPDFPTLPHIANIETQVLDHPLQIKSLLFAIFGDMRTILPEEVNETSRIIILMLSLWKRNSKASEDQLKAFVISIFTMQICTAENEIEILSGREETEIERLVEFANDMRRHFGERMDLNENDMDLLHKNAQFQAIYKEIQFLNQLLLKPICLPDPERFLHGTLVRNVYLLLTTVRDPLNEQISLFSIFQCRIELIELCCERCPGALP